jgi:4-amino-4-deoxy-L-arabinose transferase-like glycosyltransferase
MSKRLAPAAIFIASAALLWWLFGNRLILGTSDEGIYLDAAQRILRGQKPYVDFFGYMTPGSFWMQALAFRVLGVTLAAGRVLVILYVALECALVYCLVERFASRGTAIVTALLFLAFETADPAMLTAQHRWDSGAFALASIALCLSERKLAQIAAGALMAWAALATPSVALIAIVTVLWLRKRSGWYLLGIAIAGTAAVIALWIDGTLAAFLAQLAWLSRNYSAVNFMPYGSIIGGWSALFEGATAWELPVRICIVLCLALPAILPVVGVAAGAFYWFRHRDSGLPYLALCILALVISTHPRSDIAHLAYVAALSYAAAGILAYRWLAPRPRAWLAASIGVWAAVFAWQGQAAGKLTTLQTPVGAVRASAWEAPDIAALLSRVGAKPSLFVYPYKPLLYFLTQAQNPTRYSYLSPGMMTSEDARLALSELQARPPAWVLYLDLDRSAFERLFPSAKGFDPHFPEIETWLKANYQPSGATPVAGYSLLRRSSASGQAVSVTYGQNPAPVLMPVLKQPIK